MFLWLVRVCLKVSVFFFMCLVLVIIVMFLLVSMKLLVVCWNSVWFIDVFSVCRCWFMVGWVCLIVCVVVFSEFLCVMVRKMCMLF